MSTPLGSGVPVIHHLSPKLRSHRSDVSETTGQRVVHILWCNRDPTHPVEKYSVPIETWDDPVFKQLSCLVRNINKILCQSNGHFLSRLERQIRGHSVWFITGTLGNFIPPLSP